MHLSIDQDDIDPADARKTKMVRAAAYFLLHALGDIDEATEGVENTVPTGTLVTSASPPLGAGGIVFAPPLPPPPPPAEARDLTPPPPSNVVNGNFPQAPPPPPPPPHLTATYASTAAAAPAIANAPPVVAASPAAFANTTSQLLSDEYDSAGMPWDGRIHQKAKSKKKDGTWKLQKGIDPAVVAPVVAELAARKASTVSLPGFAPGAQPAGAVPVLPVAPAAAPTGVPAPPSPPPMPVPPPPPAGLVSDPYRALIDKIVDHTRNQKFDGAKVNAICQRHGAPNLMSLSSMPQLIVLVDKDIDAAALGLL